MPGADGFVQAYNTQIAVEPDFQWIVGQKVTQATNDKQQLVPTVKAVEEQARQKPQAVMTDSGYCSEANLKYLEKKKIEGFIATDKESYRRPRDRARGDRYRRERRGWTACDGNCRPRRERPSTPSVKRWWSQCLEDQTSARLPAISVTWSGESARRVGPGLSDAQHSEVTSALLWIELETTKKGHS